MGGGGSCKLAPFRVVLGREAQFNWVVFVSRSSEELLISSAQVFPFSLHCTCHTAWSTCTINWHSDFWHLL